MPWVRAQQGGFKKWNSDVWAKLLGHPQRFFGFSLSSCPWHCKQKSLYLQFSLGFGAKQRKSSGFNLIHMFAVHIWQNSFLVGTFSLLLQHTIYPKISFDVELLLHHSLCYWFNMKGKISVVSVKTMALFLQTKFFHNLYAGANIITREKKIYYFTQERAPVFNNMNYFSIL